MTDKQTLSDKRELLFKKYRLLDGFKKMILEQDKQFIKDLKEYLKDAENFNFHDLGLLQDIQRKVNTLAGDKLVEKTK
jgi:hypothetical protein